jgi:hypothetical protein
MAVHGHPQALATGIGGASARREPDDTRERDGEECRSDPAKRESGEAPEHPATVWTA